MFATGTDANTPHVASVWISPSANTCMERGTKQPRPAGLGAHGGPQWAPGATRASGMGRGAKTLLPLSNKPLFAGLELAAPAPSILVELGGMRPAPAAVWGRGAELGAAVPAPTSLTPWCGAEQAAGCFWGCGWRASWGRGAGATTQSALMELLLLQGDCYFIGLFLAARPSWEEDGWVLSWERLFACCRSPGTGL